MTETQPMTDDISVSLDYNLAVMLAAHVDQSNAYDSQAEFVQEALWDKLCEDYQSSDVLEAFIAWQEDRVTALKHDAQQTIREYEQAVTRLQEAQRDFEQTVENEAEEFFQQLEEADYTMR